MKRENIVKVVCITGGLLGVGIIAHQLLKSKREDTEEQKQAVAAVLKKEILRPKQYLKNLSLMNSLCNWEAREKMWNVCKCIC